MNEDTKVEVKVKKSELPETSVDKVIVITEPVEEPEYVHVPGTVHINAYYGAVEEAKLKVLQAQSELDAAERALEDKKQGGRV